MEAENKILQEDKVKAQEDHFTIHEQFQKIQQQNSKYDRAVSDLLTENHGLRNKVTEFERRNQRLQCESDKLNEEINTIRLERENNSIEQSSAGLFDRFNPRSRIGICSRPPRGRNDSYRHRTRRDYR